MPFFGFHAARDSEILRLKRLLDEKTEKNNSTATQSVEQTPEVIQEIRMSPRRNNSTATRSTLKVIQKNPTRMSPRRKTPQTNSKAKRVQLSENTAISHSSREEESQEVSCLRTVEAQLVPCNIKVRVSLALFTYPFPYGLN